MAVMSYQEILITNADKLLNKDTGGSSRIFAADFCVTLGKPLCTTACFCIYETRPRPLLSPGSSVGARRGKASDRIMSHGLARRASSNEIRFRGPARIVKDHKLLGQFSMGGSIFLTKCPLLETSNGITSRENEMDSLDLHAGEKVFLSNRCWKRILQKTSIRERKAI